MKEPDKNPSKNCDEMESLLIKENLDELTTDENLLIKIHLKSCEHCRSFKNALLDLQNSMRIGAKQKPVPHPAIRQNIIRQMKTKKAKEAGVFKSGWQYIRGILEYRIPVYQALFSVALILLFSLGIRQLPFPIEKKPQEQRGFAQLDVPISSQMNVIESLEIIDNQKIGRNAQEDSSLTQFILSTT